MKLYNTLSRKLEELKPIKNNQILFYHCGPTVYWAQHIGNLRAMVWADLIRRSLIFLGYNVSFVRNYTDVGHLTSDEDRGEDKMEKGAKREGLTPQEIADKYIKIFEDDCQSLNILPPDKNPRASQYIKKMQEMIKTLLEKGYAYITDLAVVYDVSKFPDYNKLNHQKLDLNIKGAGKGVVEDPQKRHFADFNLWVFKKGAHKNALQTWPSPWGEGFPGWHIECSVMAKSLLGDTIDIHMGGVEHISIHHTNEIAQSEAANEKPFVHYWLHNEHLNINNAKMAKSQGTGLTLKEITNQHFDPIDLRYFYLTSHYRSKQNFTFEALKSAGESLAKIKAFIRSYGDSVRINDDKVKQSEFYRPFVSALENDFQIPQALAVLWTMLKSSISDEEKISLLNKFDKVIGLKLFENLEINIPREIIALAEERKKARTSKDFKKSDELRDEINRQGFSLKDLDGNNYQITPTK